MNQHLTCCTSDQLAASERQRIVELAAAHRRADPEFAHWAAGYGVIRHDPLTQIRVRQMVDELVARSRTPDAATAWRQLAAANRLADHVKTLVGIRAREVVGERNRHAAKPAANIEHALVGPQASEFHKMRFEKQAVGQKVAAAGEYFARKGQGNARITWPASVPQENQKV